MRGIASTCSKFGGGASGSHRLAEGEQAGVDLSSNCLATPTLPVCSRGRSTSVERRSIEPLVEALAPAPHSLAAQSSSTLVSSQAACGRAPLTPDPASSPVHRPRRPPCDPRPHSSSRRSRSRPPCMPLPTRWAWANPRSPATLASALTRRGERRRHPHLFPSTVLGGPLRPLLCSDKRSPALTDSQDRHHRPRGRAERGRV